MITLYQPLFWYHRQLFHFFSNKFHSHSQLGISWQNWWWWSSHKKLVPAMACGYMTLVTTDTTLFSLTFSSAPDSALSCPWLSSKSHTVVAWLCCSVLTWLMRKGSRDHLSLCWPGCKSNAFPFILAVGFLCYLDLLSGALPLDSTSNFAFDLIWTTSQKGSVYSHFPYLYFYLLLPCMYWKLYTVLGEHSSMKNTETALSG